MSDEAFTAMLTAHRVFMLRVAASVAGAEAAEDVVQDACLLAWRGRATFDGHNPGAWLATITKNRAIGTLRRRRFTTVVLDLLPQRPDPAPQPEATALAREVGEAIAAALTAIPREQADAVLRCDLDGATYAQAATATGVEKATIGTRVYRGRRRLRTLLGGV